MKQMKQMKQMNGQLKPMIYEQHTLQVPIGFPFRLRFKSEEPLFLECGPQVEVVSYFFDSDEVPLFHPNRGGTYEWILVLHYPCVTSVILRRNETHSVQFLLHPHF